MKSLCVVYFANIQMRDAVSFEWIQLLEIIIIITIIIIIIIIFLEMASRVNEEITSLTLQRKLQLTFL